MSPNPIPMTRRLRVRETIVDPVQFAQRWLRTDTWGIQEKILRSLDENPRTAVKACHASGKTHIAARALLWFLARWQKCVVISTAPTWPQIEMLLWGEVHSALRQSVYPYPRALTTHLEFNSDRYAMGRSTSVTKEDEGVKFQGIHSDHVLIIIDEAPGIDPKIWEAIEGIRAGGDVRILALGNPTISSGVFFDAFKDGGQTWSLITISAFDTPNFEGIFLKYKDPATDREVVLGDPRGQDLMQMTSDELDANCRPYLITRRWVREKFLEWGPEHALWASRVLGQFPSQSEYSLISMEWLEAAKNTPAPERFESPIDVGIDVAGPGEAETTLCARRGGHIIDFGAWPQEDPRGQIVQKLNSYKPLLRSVNVDSNGVGWGLYTHLLDLKFPANPVNVGTAAVDTNKFSNLKAELYWNCRLMFQKHEVTGLLDDKTYAQLASIRYRIDERGRVVIESKDDARKRGVKSPDRAECVILAFGNICAPLEGFIKFYSGLLDAQKAGLASLSHVAGVQV